MGESTRTEKIRGSAQVTESSEEITVEDLKKCSQGRGAPAWSNNALALFRRRPPAFPIAHLHEESKAKKSAPAPRKSAPALWPDEELTTKE